MWWSPNILVRARMCELLCQQGGNCQNDVAFAAGLFSGLDALMNAPMNEILEQLPLSTELSNAILEHSGAAGQALACALAFERWDWGGAKFANLDHAQIGECFAAAVAWSFEACSDLT